MTPQELKNSILQLAIQGKLVEQRSEEGTAEELFKQIQTEKQALIKAGKIKKEKPLPEIAEDEKPFDIPESWKWVRLGEIGSWASGATPSRTNPSFYGGTIPWLKTGDLNDGHVSEVPEFITEEALEKTSVRLNPVGSVLMAMYGATIGKLAILDAPMTTNQACCACISSESVYNEYLFYFLLGYRKSFIKMGEGGAQPNISKEKIINTPFPLPPLVEQKRIVAKIEELLPLIDRYEEAWAKLEEFNKRFPGDMQKSLLQMAIQGKLVPQRPEEGTGEELYTQIQAEKQALIKSGKIKKDKPLPEIAEDEKPFDIPDSWKWVRLGSAITLLSGTDFAPEDYNDAGKGTVYITGASCLTDNGVFENRWTETPRVIAEQGDVLLVCKGSGYGKTVICDVEKAHIARQIMSIKYTPLLDMRYVRFYIMSNFTLIKQKGQGVIPGIDRGSVLNMFFPLPPLAEQKRIVAKLEELLPLCERMK